VAASTLVDKAAAAFKSFGSGLRRFLNGPVPHLVNSAAKTSVAERLLDRDLFWGARPRWLLLCGIAEARAMHLSPEQVSRAYDILDSRIL
jgi:hypothetical protein